LAKEVWNAEVEEIEELWVTAWVIYPASFSVTKDISFYMR
jgi:hypothetical protein